MPPLRLVLPHIVGLVLIGIVWTSPLKELYVYVPVIHGIFEFSTPLQITIAIKIILSIIILIVVLLIQLLRDYGTFMPKSWNMRAFFDEEGLESVVKSFSAEERKKLHIPREWHADRKSYIAHINQLLRESKASEEFVQFGPNTLGLGQFKYEYHKIRGRQRYELYDGRGYIKFEFYSQAETRSLLVEFEQIRRQADCVEPSIADLLWRFTTVVAPTFSQMASLDAPTRPLRLAAITSPTRIIFFPSIEVGRTLYLTDISELQPENTSKRMIPICYAVNQF